MNKPIPIDMATALSRLLRDLEAKVGGNPCKSGVACDGAGIAVWPHSECGACRNDQVEWFNNVYLRNVRKALADEHVDPALLEGGTREYERDIQMDEKDGDQNQ